ncbi:MAG: phage tail sheath family protein, partial [Synergistaceae bacterium]|nr:phage tail sheath family protein [Synergistaceae bacterium]
NDAGEEIDLGYDEANYLNSQGIVTAMNFANGWVAWGNHTGCYPTSTDVKDNFIPLRRMFDWIGNKFILTFWSKVDDPANTTLIRTGLNSFNYFLNGLTSQGAIVGGRIEFLSPENPLTDLMGGILRFHLYIAPPPPAEQIWAILELAPAYYDTLFSAAA